MSKEGQKFVKKKGVEHGQRPQSINRLVLSKAKVGEAEWWRGGGMGLDMTWSGSIMTDHERFQKQCSSIQILSCRH